MACDTFTADHPSAAVTPPQLGSTWWSSGYATGGHGPIRDLRHLPKKESDHLLQDGILKDVRERFAEYDDPPTNLLARTTTGVRERFAEYDDPPTNLLARTTTDVQNYMRDLIHRRNEVEDCLEPRMESINCAGDVVTISWLSNNEVICGVTTHSDSRNQQYNKPGRVDCV
ncbi:uncharacterized protein B0I36DRAFT_435970 [Microdochium trichocladiopsis]|uniref:Uncharacterized protein n=1 Tax=Microdochium trichocladiopsis TaxID=1682393 RepID=A0A9P9BIW9_9PEZI|nr:uncharacterized protein B0I36DRAFT_435970 [Microdochium trichocladiopsis]KAH7016166.1 hypothetical protein B0I36DRAFT_435970 [Microdochium trichocladiopsis]